MLKTTTKSLKIALISFLISTIPMTAATTTTIPTLIKKEAEIALSHYPALENSQIEFVIEPSMKNSFMKAQPVFSSLFRHKSKRKYRIFVSETFSLDGKELHLKNIPSNVLIGWLGHELGHVMDYKNRSSLNLIWFGIRYALSGDYIRVAERAADSYAVSNNMKDYIIGTKNFILNHADLSDTYKNKIKKLYVSPDEILKIVEEQEEAKLLTE